MSNLTCLGTLRVIERLLIVLLTGGVRYRDSDSLNAVGEIITTFLSNVTYGNMTTTDVDNGWGNPFNAREWLDENGKAWDSWHELSGPDLIHGDNFSSIFRQNTSDIYETG